MKITKDLWTLLFFKNISIVAARHTYKRKIVTREREKIHLVPALPESIFFFSFALLKFDLYEKVHCEVTGKKKLTFRSRILKQSENCFA